MKSMIEKFIEEMTSFVGSCRTQSRAIGKHRLLLAILVAMTIFIMSGCGKDDSVSPNNQDNPVPFEAKIQTAITVLTPPPVAEFRITGNGDVTLLGTAAFYSLSSVDGTLVPNIQTGSMELTSGNGDKLVGLYRGTGTPPDATGSVTFSGDYTITGGTGMYQNATGTGTYSGSASLVTATGQVTFTGTILASGVSLIP